MKRILRNNKGFTLTELIVTIALLTVFLLVSTLSIGIIFKNEVKEAAIETKSLLSTCRVSTLCGEMEPEFEIKIKDDVDDSDNNNIYIATLRFKDAAGAEIKREEVELGERFSISYRITGVTDPIFLEDEDGKRSVVISYNAQTGALEGNLIEEIIFGDDYSIKIYPKTGYMESSW